MMPTDADTAMPPGGDVCPQCSARVREGQRFCEICGHALVQSQVGSSAEASAARKWTTPALLVDRLGRYQVTDTPRALQLSLGIALRDARRFKESLAAMQRALEEEATEPSSGDILLHVADVHTRAGAPADAAHACWSAVLACPDWADEILPFLISAVTPELAATLASSTPSDWDTKFAGSGIDPADRLYAGLFWTLVLLYSGSFEQAHKTLRTLRERDHDAFRSLGPRVIGYDTLRAAAETLASGDGFFEVAKVARVLQLPQALAFGEKALELGIKGDAYPEAPVHRLRGELLEGAGRAEEAAAAYHEAGQRYLWRQELTTAVDLLERATRLRPGHSIAYWDLMDAYRSLSYIDTAPYVDRARADAARAAWDAGVRIAPPGAGESWAYCSRALLNEQLARFVAGGDEEELYWESVALLERATLYDEKNAFAYAYLGRFHRYLLNGACADQATRRAMEVDEKNLAALEERAAALSDAGEAARAVEVINKRRETDNHAGIWFDALEAFNLVCTGPYDRMLELLDKALEAEPKNIWYLALRATCYRLLDKWAEATEDSAKVWNAFDSDDAANQGNYAWAAYSLGKFDAATALFRARLTSPLEAADAHQGLGMCALAIGDISTARGHLRANIAMVNTARVLDEWLIDGVRNARHFAQDTPHQAAVDALLAELRGPIEARRGELQAGSPEEKLHTVLEGQRVLEDSGSPRAHRHWAWIGAHAALARLHRETSEWTRVSVEYQALLPEIDRFPEAILGLQKAFDGLIEAGAARLAADDVKEGLAALVEAARLERSGHITVASEAQSRLRTLLAVAAALTGDEDDTRAAAHEALEVCRAAGSDAVTRFIETCRPALRVPSTFWRVADRWRMLADDHAISQDRAADLLTIVDRLQALCLQDAFALVDTAPAVERVPIVVPIVLEIGAALVPFVDNAQDGGKFLFEAIPAMRQRIEGTLGIKVTGVRARLYSTVHSDAYRVQLEEIVVAEGQASMVDVPTFLIDTVESVLRAHAELFVGVQESEELIATWEKTPDGQSLNPEVLGSPESRLRFKRLLRTLAGERIPLTRPELILGAVRKMGLEDAESALHAIRVALAPVRFEKRQVRAIAVPAEWQRWLSHDRGKTSATAAPGETLHAMATIRRWLAAAEPPEAVVADTPPLAALVRRIAAGEFPDLVVLTQDEVKAAPSIRLPDAAPAGLSKGMSRAGA